jgi:ABC-type cobalamin/Fe3+-siderophores transport system ATPase subunit
MGRTAHLAAFAGPSRRDRALADEAIERLGLARLADAVYTRISGGERQLTLIARALAQAAPLLVMDEPTASLDFGNQLRVLDQVTALARSGIGVLLSTHDPDQAFQCADRVALLRDGGLIGQGAPREALTSESLRALYGVEVRVVDASLPDGTRRRVCVAAPA